MNHLARARQCVGKAWNNAGAAFDLKLLTPYRDLLLAVGFGFVLRGIWLWSPPAAWIAGGMGLMSASYMMAAKK